ncbi:unnamed protein product [Adineta ricciae]|uniref:Uncharacterized protein n=1 Tax=Adineta ricciae TaxID=249248 RepID=A0A815W113_ADIRI|nr:unnamed protein product [Adineta ricciae]
MYIVSTLRIGRISQSIYVPDPAIINPSLTFQFSNSCNECLCYIIDSTRNYSIINCVQDGRLCSYYTNFSSIYAFLENNNASVYLFQLPPIPSTPTQMLSTMSSTITSIVSSIKTVLTTVQTTEMPITTFSTMTTIVISFASTSSYGTKSITTHPCLLLRSDCDAVAPQLRSHCDPLHECLSLSHIHFSNIEHFTADLSVQNHFLYSNDQCNPLAYADEMNCLNLLKGVLERNNCLTSLHFHGWPSAILNFSQCDIKSVSIFELNLRSSAGFDFYYTAQQCDQLSCSTLGMQCRILTIGVKDRTCVYDLIMKMNSLQILNV